MIKVWTCAATLLFVATPAFAYPACGERQEVMRVLQDTYAEGATALGVADDGNLLEITSSADGSWTILMTRPDGISCLMASGQEWKPIQRDPEVAETTEPEDQGEGNLD